MGSLVAARLVADALEGAYPSDVAASLTRKATVLLDEGLDAVVVGEALKLWCNKPGQGVNSLPYLAADVIRKNKHNDIYEVMRKCYKTNDVTPLRKFGYWFRTPIPPDDVKAPEDMRVFMKQAQREWLIDLAKQLSGE